MTSVIQVVGTSFKDNLRQDFSVKLTKWDRLKLALYPQKIRKELAQKTITEGLRALLDASHNWATLHVMGSKIMTDDLGEHLFRFLEEVESLQDLTCTILTHQSLRWYTLVLRSPSADSLRALRVTLSAMSSKQTLLLTKALETNTHLKSLSLNGLQTDRKRDLVLFQGLARCSQEMECLEIRCARFRGEDHIDFVPSLFQLLENTTIKRLMLEDVLQEVDCLKQFLRKLCLVSRNDSVSQKKSVDLFVLGNITTKDGKQFQELVKEDDCVRANVIVLPKL